MSSAKPVVIDTPKDGYELVVVRVRRKHLLLAHAIGAAFTAINDPRENPFSVEQILEMCLLEGVVLNEADFLGTRYGAESDTGDNLPYATKPMLALLRAAIIHFGWTLDELPDEDGRLRADRDESAPAEVAQ